VSDLDLELSGEEEEVAAEQFKLDPEGSCNILLNLPSVLLK
jgi:hypothetical protein